MEVCQEPEKPSNFFLTLSHRVCLFSEGLDSYCGLGNRLATTPDRFLAVSGIIQTRCSPLISQGIKSLNDKYEDRVTPLPIRMYAIQSDNIKKKDTYQRSRSFLLLILGAVVALTIGKDEVEIYENGLESFGFPCDPNALPAQESRAMHPLFLDRMSCFVSALVDRPFRFVAPNLFKTKGDMLKSVQSLCDDNFWEITNSCMHFAARVLRKRHCGRCAGCVLRQLAFQISGTPDNPMDYHNPVEGARFIKRLSAYDLMRGLVNRLNHKLSQSDSWNALLDISGVESEYWYNEFLPAISRVGNIDEQVVPFKVSDLFRRYVHEWESVYGM
jgi:7-cyano-7-deazaguanine synthase in queuosine biosynthesis